MQYLIKMLFSKIVFSLVLLIFIYSCNSGKTDEEMDELWSEAQTTGQIIKRSGTKFNSGSNKQLALNDAKNRLRTGGGILDAEFSFGGIMSSDKNKNASVGTMGMTINKFLWRGSLDTIDFMPISSADPIGGTIITDWYSSNSIDNERCKINIFITGIELKTQNLKVTSFCQNYENNKWINKETSQEDNVKIENAILNKAKKFRLQSS